MLLFSFAAFLLAPAAGAQTASRPASQPAPAKSAQQVPPGAPAPAQQPAPGAPAAAPAQPPASGAPAPAAQTTPDQQATTPAASQPSANTRIAFNLVNADLLRLIEIIAGELKMNYVVDPGVKGVVTINTRGDLRQEDLLGVLQTILRANGAVAVQSGSFWRIVLLKDAPRVPTGVDHDLAAAQIPTDDRMVMNVIALGYVTAADMSEIMKGYLSEAGQITRYDPGNVLLITETSRNMRRLMDLVALFDTDTLAQKRIRVFSVENAQARDLVYDLAGIFSAYAMSDKAAVKFLPIDRINSILVVSGNPNIFNDVKQWIDKLDKPMRKSGIQNFVYRVENASAENLASVLGSLYGIGGYTQQRPQGTTGLMGGPGSTGGFGSSGYGGTGTSGGGLGGTSGYGGGAGTYGGVAAQSPLASGGVGALGGSQQQRGPGEMVAPPGGMLQSGVKIVADIINNALIVQATPQDWEVIRQTIKELDIIPRQVLIEAKVYEVTLTGALSFGVEYFLQHRSDFDRKPVGQFSFSGTTAFPNPGLSLSTGTLIGHSRELLAFLNAQENRSRTRVVSAPTVLASDNMEARIQVGAEVPILTSQGVIPGVVGGGTQLGNSSVFTNTVQQRDTGVILSVMPRINSSGMVTLKIAQEVSQAIAPPTNTIQSPTISKRSVMTQATVQDGETIALGGIIEETKLTTKNRVPLLGDIPILGVLFGSTSYTSTPNRTDRAADSAGAAGCGRRRRRYQGVPRSPQRDQESHQRDAGGLRKAAVAGAIPSEARPRGPHHVLSSVMGWVSGSASQVPQPGDALAYARASAGLWTWKLGFPKKVVDREAAALILSSRLPRLMGRVNPV